MVSFAKELSADDVKSVRSYVIFRANQSKESATQASSEK